MKMYDDYNSKLDESCEVFENPFIPCEECGELCRDFDLEDGVCADCAETGLNKEVKENE